jgi:hypothetical protein
MSEITWDTNIPSGWADAVSGWNWRDWKEDDVSVGQRKWGPCPRCEHTMAVYAKAVRAILPVDVVDARCNCRAAHRGRPNGADGGCGVGSGESVEIPVR